MFLCSWHPLVLDEDRRCFSLHWPQAISAEKSQDFFLKLLAVAPWVELLNTKGTSVTRSTCWFSSGGCTCDYAYGRETRVTNADVMNAADGRAQAEDMTGSDQFIHGSVEAEPLSDESLSGFKAAMEEIMQHVFGDLFPGLEKEAWPNSANINLYRDGRQGVGWHADDESLFCGKDSDCPVVSISLGATRETGIKSLAAPWGSWRSLIARKQRQEPGRWWCLAAGAALTACNARRQHRKKTRTSEALYVSLEDAVIEEPLEEPHVSQLASVFQSLVGNGMGVIPTDTQHAYVTPVSSKSGVRRIYDIKGVAADQRKPLSLLCSDLSMASKYCDVAALPRKWFQNMKACLPGPYTFILRASGEVPRIVMDHKSRSKVWKRREVGIRVPNNSIVWQLVEDLEAPLLASSAPDSAVEIWTEQKDKLDFVVGAEAIVEMWAGMEKEDRVSTVVDLTMEEPVLRRQGLGDVSMFDDMVDAAMFE
ncbi:yciO [Symbiodinium sp. CCMP2592]|nr:yciO [Symbiodinium sp. CCMP2592]